MARHHKTTQLGLMWLSVLGIMMLILMGYIIVRL